MDGWPLWACLTGNRCVSSEDEGPADKHYWRTSAACHNTGRAGTAPHPSATPESGWWGAPSSASGPVHPSLTSGGDAGYGVHVWSRHLPASAGPQPPLADRGENAPAHMKNAFGIALSLRLTLTPYTHTQESRHVRTPYTTSVPRSGASHTPSHFRLLSGRQAWP